MAALLAASLTTVLVLHLMASGARWLCLVGLGLLVCRGQVFSDIPIGEVRSS